MLIPTPVKQPLLRIAQYLARGQYRRMRESVAVLHDARGGSPYAATAAFAKLTAWPRRRVLCYPKLPSRHQVLFRLFLLLGYKMTRDLTEEYDVAFIFRPGTVNPPLSLGGVRPGATINKDARDVSKSTVEARFEEAFGYAIGVDPECFEGLAVRKSEVNYTHDGEIIACPYKPPAGEEGVTYQRYIDTSTPDGYFVDLRVPLYDGEIPIVYRKYHPNTDRRFFDVSHVDLLRSDDALSKVEQDRLAELAKVMGVDFGEFDVLRDNNDGRIYVVDVNPTPSGPVKGFTRAQRQRALRMLAPAFERMIERRVRA